MANGSALSVPTTARIPSSLRISSSSPIVQRIFNRLSRASLIQLALDWLDIRSDGVSFPVFRQSSQDDGDFYPPADSVEELQELYLAMAERKGPKREVVDRMLEGDWRAGITMYQLAMADLQYLYDHPTSQKWTSYHILPLRPQPTSNSAGNNVFHVDKKSMEMPRFHPSSFLEKLQLEVLPDSKTHCHFDRHKTLPLLILRLFIFESPYSFDVRHRVSKDASPMDSARTIYLAFPDSAPFLYLTKPQAVGPSSAVDSKTIKAIIVDGIPKALSRPRQRYTLKPTDLVTNNLSALLYTNSSGRTNAAGGGWSVYADEKKKDTPLERVLPTAQNADSDELGPTSKRKPQEASDARALKRRKQVAKGRFGISALPGDGTGIERMDVVLSNAKLSNRDTAGIDHENSTASVRVCFAGSHVFAGIRQLVECGAIDGETMPGWMTGEEGVTVGTVENGRMRGHKGSGGV
ncbi:hypothetical protein TD95_001971 [Thielaviopsis punctulata]|uniref:CHL4-domain-containing protein n=1 Tax=Thielaviopsis punctulata TaxID=72032 RepID=A0A0F4ZB18_9PEZI|nr:hypothetical protein TD95_001971 [Thielaviopsis punctulata]